MEACPGDIERYKAMVKSPDDDIVTKESLRPHILCERSLTEDEAHHRDAYGCGILDPVVDYRGSEAVD